MNLEDWHFEIFELFGHQSSVPQKPWSFDGFVLFPNFITCPDVHDFKGLVKNLSKLQVPLRAILLAMGDLLRKIITISKFRVYFAVLLGPS